MPATKCPRCLNEYDDNADIALHLVQDHNYTYEKAMQWIREREELCGR